jgi:hypothetical protein
VEISTYNTPTKRSLNLAPPNKISKSGDGGDSGGCLGTKGCCKYIYSKESLANIVKIIIVMIK